MIQFRCECGRQLKVKDELAGRKVTCPACESTQRVPDDEDVGIQERPRSPRADRPARLAGPTFDR